MAAHTRVKMVFNVFKSSSLVRNVCSLESRFNLPSVTYNFSDNQDIRKQLPTVNQMQLVSLRGFKTCSTAWSKADKNDDSLHGDKMLNVKLKAQRLDAVLKAGLGMSRNKVEKAIYDDRVRVNGVRPEKKSQTIYEGDEIDLVRGYNELNPDQFIDVSRIEVVKLKDPDDDDSSDSDDEKDFRIPASLRRSKQLTIRNYSPPWRGSSQT